MLRNRAVAIVIHDNKLLAMFRKNDREYYTFPGGGIEPDETIEQAVIREVMEETSLEVEVEKLAYEVHHDNDDIHYFFLCRYVSGTPDIQPGTNEYADNIQGEDIHIPEWLPLQNISKTVLYPLEVRDQLIADIEKGFAKQVVTFNLKAVKQPK